MADDQTTPASDTPSDPDATKRDLADQVVRQLTRTITRKDIRQMLVELTKQRATDVLNLFSDTDRDHQTITMVGTSPMQIILVRRWLARVVAPELIRAYGQWLADGTLPPPEPAPAHATTLSLAVDDSSAEAKWTETPPDDAPAND